jgi:hypothetical protein
VQLCRSRPDDDPEREAGITGKGSRCGCMHDTDLCCCLKLVAMNARETEDREGGGAILSCCGSYVQTAVGSETDIDVELWTGGQIRRDSFYF